MNDVAPPPAQRLRAIATSRPVIIGLLVLLIYTLAGFFAAPWLLKQQLPKLIGGQFNAQATVAEVHVNPFLFSIEIKDLAIAEKSGLAALQVGRIFVDFETSSLLRWAWTFREIRIERPVINADLDANENLNFARLLQPQKPAPEQDQAPGALPRLLLQHFSMSDGIFRFTDHTLAPAARTQLDPINFEIHDIATLPDHQGEHSLMARLPGGGSLQWKGRLSLAPIESSGTLALREARLSTLWQFVRDQVAIAEPEGTYEFGLRYRAGYPGGKLSVLVDNIAFRLNDLALTRPQGGDAIGKLKTLALEGGKFDLAQRNLTFKDVRIADGAFSLTLDEDGIFDWTQLLRPSAVAAPSAAVDKPPAEPAVSPAEPWRLALPQVSIGSLALTVVDNSRAKPLRMTVAKTQLTMSLDAALGNQPQITVGNADLKLDEIRVMSGDEKEPPVTLSSATLTNGAFDLQKKTIRAEKLRLSGGRTWVMRDEDGSLQLVSVFAPRKHKPLQEAGFTITVDRTELAEYAVALTDRTFQPEVAYDLEQVNAAISGVTLPPRQASPFELALRVKQGGSLRAKGSINLPQQSVEMSFEAADLALLPLDTVLKRETTLNLVSGKAGASGRVSLNAKNAPPLIRYSGAALVSDLEVQTATGKERLIGWQRLEATEINFSSAENQLAITRLGLVRPYAKLIIHKDRSTNFAGIKRSDPATTTAAAAPAKEAAAPPVINVDRVNVEGGTMDFADLSLVLPFATLIKDLGGSVSGLSSATDARANLKLEGGVGEYGLARAEGSIQPFAPKKFTDIAVTFRNVDLPPMSPYSATFAGRRIASGKVSLDLQYKIDNSNLAGENRVRLEQFTLGERVESPTAVNLPLDLAIALLTDSDGKIDLSLPVSGDVDNPEFSYGAVVWQAIRTVLTRIVTAPFRALGALFGGNAEALGDIVFDAGSARILPTEQEKLQRVAEGLQKRPQLKLVVQGQYHKADDGRALRARAVRADLAAREGLKLLPGEDPGAISFDSAKTQRQLEIMLDARAGDNAAAQFAGAFRKTAGGDVTRVNAALALLGRGAGNRELYVAMHGRLVELQPLPDPALTALGKARGDAISEAFTGRLKLDPARIGSKPAAAAEELAKNGVPAKLTFETLK